MSEEQKIPKTEFKENMDTDSKQRLTLFRIGLMIFITFVCCILFFFILLRYEGFSSAWHKLLSAAQPIIIGLVIAYLLNPIMKFWEEIFLKLLERRIQVEKKRKKVARGIGVAFAIIILIIIIALLLLAIVPSFYTSVSSLVDTLPGQVQALLKTIQNGDFGDSQIAWVASEVLTKGTAFLEDWAENKFLPEIQTYITQITSGVISIIKAVINFVIGIIVAMYVMMIQDTLQGQAKKIIYSIFTPRHGNAIIHTVRKSSEIFGGFITGKLLDSLIIGIICYVGCLILRIPDSILVSVIIGVTNVIPFFGPFIGAIPTLLLVVIQSPWHALYLFIFIIVLQQVDGNIIGPKILGDSTGLSSFWVMFAILVFGGVWGFFGMLLGVPSMAVIYYIVGKLVSAGLRKKNLPYKTEEYIAARGINIDSNTIRYTKAVEPEPELENKKDK